MKLVMFDMDGTLTDSFALDENCYVRAIEQALGLTGVRTDWAGYPHTSSSYCLETIVRESLGRPPTAEESRAVQQTMIGLMNEATRRHGRTTREIPGAAAALTALQRLGLAVAIASGDWEATARHKLGAAGIPFEHLPSAYSDVAHARTAIMRTALIRAEAHHGVTAFEHVTYVGDASWDVRACRELAWPLICIGDGAHADHLQAQGATQVLPDYRDFPAFLGALDRATSPRRAAT
jgi:phosphoglycolate phosphatase-like HAD superfamily hydrolase